MKQIFQVFAKKCYSRKRILKNHQIVQREKMYIIKVDMLEILTFFNPCKLLSLRITVKGPACQI